MDCLATRLATLSYPFGLEVKLPLGGWPSCAANRILPSGALMHTILIAHHCRAPRAHLAACEPIALLRQVDDLLAVPVQQLEAIA